MAVLHLCDLCYMDDKERRAVARYWDAEGHDWVVCRKCLELVKKAELKYEELEQAPPVGE